MSKSTNGLRKAGLASIAVALTLGAAGVASPAQAAWAATGGEIGLVDTNKDVADNGTQGATVIQSGVDGQDLGDVRLLIPNQFQNGDTIDLVIFDRSATATDAGQINADAAHRLGFSDVPDVTVDNTPYEQSTSIGPESESDDNTEGTGDAAADAYEPPAAPAANDPPTTPPRFNASLVQSSRANGLANDIIRLRVDGVQANGNPNAEWVVTLDDIHVDLGPAVSPGELRLVPFAYNGTPAQTGTNASPMFSGNLPDTDLNPATFDPTIGIYTVPGYVAPVTFNVGAPNNVLADGTTQRVGDITIAETNNYSMQNGTYTVEVDGVDIENDADSPVTVTATNAATGEEVSDTATVAGDQLSFDLNGASNTSKLTVTLSGLLVSDNSPSRITYTLSGGSIDEFMASPAGSSPRIPTGYTGEPGAQGVYSDDEFSPNVNQDDIQPATAFLTVESVSRDVERRIGGGNRYETAAKIALNNGSNDYVVLASGQNFPDALSSNYLSQQIGGGSILLTRENSIPQVTLSAMRELGTRTVFVVGGEGAIDGDVVEQLEDTPQYYPGGHKTIGQGKLHVVRLAGDNRYETNREVNEYAAALFQDDNPVGRTNIEFGEASKLTAFLATGQKFADALAAGPATAGVEGWGNLPLLLSKSDDLHGAAKDQLTSLGIEQVIVVGGEGAVDADVVHEIEDMDIDVMRIAGDNRYDTAAHLADFLIADAEPTVNTDGGLGFDDTSEGDDQRAYLATGQKFADALAGGPLAAGVGSPILLTKSDELHAATEDWFEVHASAYSTVVALGLGGAVAPSVLDDANEAIAGQ